MLKYFILLFLATSNAFGLESLKIQTGRYLAIENHILDSQKPTAIFLPGVNRGLDARDEFIELAKKAKLNFVSIHFSLHPESVMLIPNSEVAYFKLHKITAKDLADEVRAVIKSYKVEKPLVVGLSYSAIVTSELAADGKLPLIVETAPMMRFDDGDPDSTSAQFADFWKNYYASIPIFGNIWKDVFLQQIYQQFWSKEIDSILENYPKAKNNFSLRSSLITAFTMLSIAADGFDFKNQDFTSGTKRLFILGKEESAHRYELQIKGISFYEEQTGEDKTTIVIPGAGHIVPSDTPAAYLKAIKNALRNY